MKKIIAIVLVVVLSTALCVFSVSAESTTVAQGADLEKMSEDLQNTLKQMSEEDKTDVYLKIEPAIKYDGSYNAKLKSRVLEKMGLTSVPTWKDDPEGHRQFEALRYSMLMEDYNKNAVALLELLNVPEEDNLTPTSVTMYWHWRLTASQICLASEQACVLEMQTTEFVLDDDEEPDLEAEIQYKDKFEEWSVKKFGEGVLNNYGYTYNELYTHFDGDNPDWVLCQAKYGDFESPMITWLRIGGIGGRTVIGMSWDNPFATGYGIYDVEANEFYALEDLTDDCFMPKYTGQSADKYEGLTDALAELNIGYATGDANKDNKVDILDATLIQKSASGKTTGMGYVDNYIVDVNNDNVVDILDATAIQRYAVSE